MATKLATLALGSAVALVALRAYRRTGNRSLRSLGAGFGLLAAGAVVAGLLHTALGLTVVESQTVQSLFTASGLAVIVHSLLVDDRTSSAATGRGRRSAGGRD